MTSAGGAGFGGQGWHPPADDVKTQISELEDDELEDSEFEDDELEDDELEEDELEDDAGALVGTVKGFHAYSEQDALTHQRQSTVWSFRVVRYDSAGDFLDETPVEMRGRTFRGSIRDGDRVHVLGGAHNPGVRAVERVWNERTQSMVEAVRWRFPRWLVAAMIVVGGVVILVIIFTVVMIVRFIIDPPQPPWIQSG